MADLEAFRKMIRRYYRQTYREDGKTKHQQQDLANMIVINEDELGKRLNEYRDEKTGRVWRLTEENVLDIVLVLAEWQALNGKQAVELLDLMDYPLETTSTWKVRLQKHFSLSELVQFPMSKGTPSAIVPVAPQGGQLLQPRHYLFQARDLPKGYVPRPKAFNKIKQLLLNHQENQTAAITTALHGAGGFGKTTLALALCHDPEIQVAFPDGILWVELGEHPPRSLDVLNGVLASLDRSLSGAITLEEVRDRWRTALQERVCLLVIDDVWQTVALEPLLEGGPYCVRLMTTRNDQVLPEEAAHIWVDAMEAEEAIAVLHRGLPDEVQQVAYQLRLKELAKRLGYWPLLLTLAHGMLTSLVKRGQTIEKALTNIEKAYQTRGVTAFHQENAEERQQTVDACLEVSLRHLKKISPIHYDAITRYHELAVYPEDTDIPLNALHTYWQGTGGLEDWEMEDLCVCLDDLSLIQVADFGTSMIRLHDVFRSYLIQHAGADLPVLHTRLLDAYQKKYDLTRWADLPSSEAYLWQHLIFHLYQAGRPEALQTTLTDLRYLTCNALYVGVPALEADLLLAYTHNGTEAEMDASSLFTSLHQTIVRISHLLQQVSTEAEIGGLLLGHVGSYPPFAAQVTAFEHELPRPFLTTWHPLPSGSSSALLRTLRGHTSLVTSCAISPDGRFIVSASSDNALKVWNTAAGAQRLTLHNWSITRILHHSPFDDFYNQVNDCAVSPDGRWIVSAFNDSTLKVWDATIGELRLTLYGHTSRVNGCAVSPDGSWIVSASDDHTLKVWDAATGVQRLTFGYPSSRVTGCAVSPDGQWIVSSCSNKTLKVWDATTGVQRLTLYGHALGVNSCAVSPDGSWIVSASDDSTLKVWDATTGVRRLTLSGHAWIRGCVISPDGHTIVSASIDKTLKVWDATTGAQCLTLYGHTDSVNDCAVSPDGCWIVSASDDKTLKVWDARTGACVLTFPVDGALSGCAFHPDGKHLVAYGALGVYFLRMVV